MKNKQNNADVLPDEFDSLEELAEFWDTHDTTEYLDAFTDAGDITLDIQERRVEIDIDADVAALLKRESHRKHVSASALASKLLRKDLISLSPAG